jgi:iron only hydrogenase large subunit-like protein
MSFDNIGSAMMLIYDELSKDKKSKALIKQIDEATDDSQIKKGIVAGVKRLRELDKNTLADEIEKKTKGFAF